jgi:predicted enzyme related to lactoylglutathione lyase
VRDWLSHFDRFWSGKLARAGRIPGPHSMKRDLRFEVFLPHPPEKVWRALTDPRAIAQWLMENDFAAIGAAEGVGGATGQERAQPRRPEVEIEKVTAVSIYVRDQDEALRWYQEALDFEKRADDRSMPGFRWLTVAPRSHPDFQVVLLQAGDEEMSLVGKNPTWVLRTRDCRKMTELLQKRGVTFLSPPRDTAWGISAVFEDLYWKRIQPDRALPKAAPSHT